MKYESNFKLASALTLSVAALTACGGGGGGGSTANTLDTTGTLVVAQSSTTTARSILQKANGITPRTAACPEVPAGYAPLQNVTVEFLADDASVLTTTTTDSCGGFSAQVPEETVQVRAQSTDNRDLITDVDVFGATGGGVASTIPSTADYQIASLQVTTDQSLAFTVSDTLTNKAVIGVPSSAFSVQVNTADVAVDSVGLASTSADPASVMLVVDASGSMGAAIYDENSDPVQDSNGVVYSRTRIAALAAHTYLDNMPTTDETAMVIFDNQVNLINNAEIASIFTLVDPTTLTPASYTFSDSGFTNTAAELRFVVDGYNDDSTLYNDSNPDMRHADSPDVAIASYPWGGSTALFDAVSISIDEIITRTSARKVIVAMSDGGDNASAINETDLIAKAVNNGIPVYTIAYEDSDEASMQNIATSTGATSFTVQGTDLTAAFQSIQSGITFQYIAALQNALAVGDMVTLNMDYNGLTATRDITR